MTSPSRVAASSPPLLVVFSHLRWEFVLQRPQHLMTRLARWWRVLFIEEPVRSDRAHIVSHQVAPNVEVLVPHTPVAAPGFHDEQIAALHGLLAPRLAGERIDVGWLYTPMALPLLDTLSPTCLVYDCMDELTAFKDAPRQLRQRESALLRRADVVFTGGPSLFEARRALHPRVYCVPSSVDGDHFSPARLSDDSPLARQAQTLQGALPGPRLGFYGVIDERMDLGLIDRLARARPDWSVVMVGPVVKIDPATLPRHPNLHWLGMQPYALLPYLLAGWDVALMPFARNDATRFISPTKTLEYLAGEKPVVSTAIADVIGLYGHAVEVVHGNGDEFVAACERVLHENPTRRERRMHATLATVATQSWDHSARSVHELLRAALARTQAVEPVVAATAPAALPKVAVAGAR